MADNVNHPAHYTMGAVECIDGIKSALGGYYYGYLWGNALKYLWRHPHKGGFEDLEKAAWYIERMMEEANDGRVAVED